MVTSRLEILSRWFLMVSKTRDKLIEVARQLFFYKGVENTTMNDIAAASDKGRRTIYTYFKNKLEIYNAVIESQSNTVIDKLKEIAESSLPYPERLRKYLIARFNAIQELVPHSKTPYDRYKSFFNRDARRYEKIFEIERDKEKELLSRMLNEGVAAGYFYEEQAKVLPSLLLLVYMTIDQMLLQSIDSQEINIGKLCDDVIAFVMNGISINKTQNI